MAEKLLLAVAITFSLNLLIAHRTHPANQLQAKAWLDQPFQIAKHWGDRLF